MLSLLVIVSDLEHTSFRLLVRPTKPTNSWTQSWPTMLTLNLHSRILFTLSSLGWFFRHYKHMSSATRMETFVYIYNHIITSAKDKIDCAPFKIPQPFHTACCPTQWELNCGVITICKEICSKMRYAPLEKFDAWSHKMDSWYKGRCHYSTPETLILWFSI